MQIRLIGALALTSLLAAGVASATTPSKPMTTSQQRMAECSHQSKGMKGAAHKKFMSECMKGHAAASMAGSKHMMAGHEMVKPMMGGKHMMAGHEMAKPMMGGKHMMNGKAMQQEKMKDCSAEAKTKKLSGAARKTFMSSCLKGS